MTLIALGIGLGLLVLVGPSLPWHRVGPDRGVLPALVLLAIGAFLLRARPEAARVLVACAWLAIVYAYAARLTTQINFRGYGQGAPAAYFYAGLERLLGFGAGAVLLFAVARLFFAPRDLRGGLVVLVPVVMVWSELVGWYSLPCARSYEMCSPLVHAELARGEMGQARWLAKILLPRDHNDRLVYVVAERTGDPYWAEPLLAPTCTSAPNRRDKCRFIGDLFDKFGDLPRAMEWWDRACSVTPVMPWEGACQVNESRLVAAGRWSDLERYFRLTCQGRRQDWIQKNCLDHVPERLAKLKRPRDVP